ncbi:hypothetical protein EJ05DRAFT_222375 [Pseudovirgaria hyperparasitica]|uniref:Uncharacterized protein n=1 Tax=Pseudovirgaria hyperparasitica TaxID=470096 RepID=A0A6A6VSJ0_9PEZI|nr:uncharacterized protein EJ05DRAFT_237668 [Pseudovirgaria hyperparasitica]XP_033595633.1 uncharacterized protein EJ05DRAFT_222375 [Pseudovirgaria hyperparasitica]KAF2752839.1 hypothetical protein EJ05DRAFT_237668 [Pseudovirgaria hyperparasitica]KAF2753182.1 hypothetical protein EJ05DRAFT_222375 [Pseudovirgaria hyperparasitica]
MPGREDLSNSRRVPDHLIDPSRPTSPYRERQDQLSQHPPVASPTTIYIGLSRLCNIAVLLIVLLI